MITFKERALKIINAVGVVGQAFAASPIPAGGQAATGAITANTRFNVAHGLGYKPNQWAVSAAVMSLDDDTATYGLTLVKVDTTNLVFKPTATVAAASISFLITIQLDTDIGGRNSAY